MLADATPKDSVKENSSLCRSVGLRNLSRQTVSHPGPRSVEATEQDVCLADKDEGKLGQRGPARDSGGSLLTAGEDEQERNVLDIVERRGGELRPIQSVGRRRPASIGPV